MAGDDLGEGPGLDTYDLNNLRWLNTLDVRNQEIARLEHARALDALAERALREERDALRAAVRALFARADEDFSFLRCVHCNAPATRQVTGRRGEVFCDACDGRRPDSSRADLPLAAEVRALLALLPPEAP